MRVSPVAGAAMILQNRIHGDNYNAVGCQNEEWGRSQAPESFYQRQFGTAKVKGTGMLFYKGRRVQKGRKRAAPARGAAAPAISMMKTKINKGSRMIFKTAPMGGGYHSKHGISLGGDEIIHAHGQQGEKSAAGVNGQIDIRIGIGNVTGAEPAQKHSFGKQGKRR